jgi:hypothetical protein
MAITPNRAGGTAEPPARGAGATSASARSVGTWGFAGVAFASIGGPLALAGLIVPAVTAGAVSSAGLTTIAAAVVFGAPLAIWLIYARHLTGGVQQHGPSGGLYSFVLAAAGRRVALAQAAVWTLSYLLYIVYTTVQIVYDVLPQVLPGSRQYQTVLALLIPVAIAGVMIAGRAAALIVIGAVAASQLVLGGILDGVTVAHLGFPVSSFGASASAGSFAQAGAKSSLLYICAGLPLFLGGEVARPGPTVRRGVIGAYLVTVAIVVLAVAPLAAAPGITRTDVPGFELTTQFASAGLARAIGVGIAVSVGGVILCEYLALTRLAAAVGGWTTRRASIIIGATMVAAAPLSLIDPNRFYDDLARPSLAALWVSQLIVFACFPLFAWRRGLRMVPACALASVASAFAIYGLWLSIAHPVS